MKRTREALVERMSDRKLLEAADPATIEKLERMARDEAGLYSAEIVLSCIAAIKYERAKLAPVIEAVVLLLRKINDEAKYMPMQLVPSVARTQAALHAYDAGLLEDEAQHGKE
jgi:hypothetical protein